MNASDLPTNNAVYINAIKSGLVSVDTDFNFEKLGIGGWGEYESAGDQGFVGYVGEIIIFNGALEDSEIIKINYYLSKKWGLTERIDSDGDGFLDSIEEMSASSAIDPLDTPQVSFYTTLIGEVGEESIIEATIEEGLELWYDASNIDLSYNTTISDGDSISTWLDLSGKGNSAIQPNIDNQPKFNSGDNSLIFDGANDFMPISNKVYTTSTLENLNIFAVLKVKFNQCK